MLYFNCNVNKIANLKEGGAISHSMPDAAKLGLFFNDHILHATIVALLGSQDSTNTTSNNDHLGLFGICVRGKTKGDFCGCHCKLVICYRKEEDRSPPKNHFRIYYHYVRKDKFSKDKARIKARVRRFAQSALQNSKRGAVINF